MNANLKLRCILTAIFILSASFVAQADEKPHLVMLIAEREYHTDESLTEFSKKHLGEYKVTMVRADEKDRESLVGLDAIQSADVLLVSVRRRTLPPEQLDQIRKYVAAGKPVLGIRTANHAFCLRKQDPPKGRAAWPEWDHNVFGGSYTNHYGNKLTTSFHVLKENETHPLLKGVSKSKSFTTGGSLYKVAPLREGTTVVLTGSVPDNPPEPIAWTFKRADNGKSFYTSLGHIDDFKGEVLPQLLKNAIKWSLQP